MSDQGFTTPDGRSFAPVAPQTYGDAVALHRLTRGLTELTIGAPEDTEARREALIPVSAANMSQLVSVGTSGKVSDVPVLTEIPITFPHPFANGVTRTAVEDSLPTPHFTMGIELLSKEHIIIDAQVTKWTADQSGFYTGCTVRVGAWSPMAGKKQEFAAIVHLTFTGYGVPHEDEDQETGTYPLLDPSGV